MKKTCFLTLLFLSAFCLHAQKPESDFSRKWMLIDSLITKKGLTESALLQVQQVYQSALAAKNEPQRLKALIYIIGLQSQKQEEDQFVISRLEKEIKTSQGISRAILNNILAGAYWNYFQQHRYQLYDRTQTEQAATDIRTWTFNDFHRTIARLFLASIKDEEPLKKINLDQYEPLIIKGNVRYLRPTLYDLLAHRALDYFKNDERDLSRPAYAFQLDDTTVFSAASQFINHIFKTDDSASLQFQAVLLFQKLLRFHLADARPDAFLDLDIERISFASQYAVLPDKEERFTQALKTIADRWGDEPAAGQAWFLLASGWASSAEEFDPVSDTANRYHYLKALEICKKLVQQKDSSLGKANAEELIRKISKREFSIEIEKVNIPDQPFRSLLSFRNVRRLYFHIVSIDHKKRLEIGQNNYDALYWNSLLELPVIRTYTQVLPETGDFQSHSMEIKIDALPAGAYALLLSPDSVFQSAGAPLAVQYFYVSRIAFIKNGNDYFVLDRQSGHPLPGTTVEAWYKYYDNKKRKYVERRGEQFNTDRNGFFHLEPSRNIQNSAVLLNFTRGDDQYFPDSENDIVYSYDKEQEERPKDSTTYFFTDRSIYRPGQTVYFKGIVIAADSANHAQIVAGLKTTVILYDGNGVRIDSAQLLTNEFGSYHGSFFIPEGKLNGLFRIEDATTGRDLNFSVEEYKRPGFFITYDSLKTSIRIMDSVHVSGSAKAYSGYPVNNAHYTFNVTRESRFPYSWREGYLRNRRQSPKEMAHGSGIADANGQFNIVFNAWPDPNLGRDKDPVFIYHCHIDLTDGNGETRSQEQTVFAGYKSIVLTMQWPQGKSITTDQFRNIRVNAETINGFSISRPVKISISTLQAPSRLIRQRLWKQPDLFLIDQKEYLRYFPNDEYSNEAEAENWPVIKKLVEFTDSSSADKSIALPVKTFPPGWYLVEAIASDEFGQTVKDKAYIQLTDAVTGASVSPRYEWIKNETMAAQPGEKASLHIGTSAAGVFIILENKSTKRIPGPKKYSFVSLTNEMKKFEYPVTESDRGGFEESHAFVKDNRFYSGFHAISVPWTNKRIKIGYSSFREKTLPGSKETWKINISGSGKDQLVAEVLTGMYDASLDQFKPQEWKEPALYPLLSPENDWSDYGNFTAQTSLEKYIPEKTRFFYSKNYDQLIDVDNTIVNRRFAFRPNMALPLKAKAGSPGLVNSVSLGIAMDSESYQKEGRYAMAEKPAKPVAANENQAAIQIRTNFKETAFFFPDLKTDSLGNVQFSFQIPEALTEWKWMLLAHTKNLDFGYAEKTILTRKQLMVQANAPRFLREGDRIEFSAKLVNLTDSERSGQIELQLSDPLTGESVDGEFNNMQPNQYFTVGAKQSIIVHFSLTVPFQYNRPVSYRILASSDAKDGLSAISDGEQASIPVLSSMQLITEAIPLTLNNIAGKDFRFNALLNSGSSETVQNQSLTVEFSSNPSWYAVEALPYLIEYPYECAEQSFNRFYANSLSRGIVGSLPGLAMLLQSGNSANGGLQQSDLEKKQELKSVLLQETPWVMEAKTEAEQKQNLIHLLDSSRIYAELGSTLNKLAGLQSESGGFAWFSGGRDDRYITQYILSGMGHLMKLNMLDGVQTGVLKDIIAKGLAYADQQLEEDYKNSLESKKEKPAGLSGLEDGQIQYLYMRSFFLTYPLKGDVLPAINFYKAQAKQKWLSRSPQLQAMIALALYRTGDGQAAAGILRSLKQQAIQDAEGGMHWKQTGPAYYWRESAVETQAIMIEAFSEITKDTKTVNALQTWLLLQKETQHWNTTRATADACYALLMKGHADLNYHPGVNLRLGNMRIHKTAAETMAGSGYFKVLIPAEKIKPEMGNLSVSLDPPPPSLAWGAVYWQYFEQMDKLKSTQSAFGISRKLFIERNGSGGPFLEEIRDNASLKLGDKLVVRLMITANTDMEYVQLKDLRASCTEPQQVLSGYQWKGGLGYYQTVKDASMMFFFDRLPKGSYVLEYPLFITHAGDFGAGMGTLQCMYAPQFSAHSEGLHIHVD